MEFRVLRYFLTVANERNITRTAEHLHITQPSLSRQLAQLEEEMGVKLFERGSRNITLTEKGMLLRRRAEEIILQIDKTENELKEKQDAISGTISIGCGEFLAVQLLAEILNTFKTKYPAVTYKLFTGNAENISEYLKIGLIDLGLMLEHVDFSEYEFIRLGVKERWIILMRTDDPLAKKKYITSKDLVGKNIILPWRQVVCNEIAKYMGTDFNKMNVIMNVNMSTDATIMVKNHMGYSINCEGSLPYLDTTQICQKPLYPEFGSTNILAWKKYQPTSMIVAKFIKHVQAYLQEHQNEIKAKYWDYD